MQLITLAPSHYDLVFENREKFKYFLEKEGGRKKIQKVLVHAILCTRVHVAIEIEAAIRN